MINWWCPPPPLPTQLMEHFRHAQRCDTLSTRKWGAHLSLSLSFHNWFCTELPPRSPLTDWIIGISIASVDKDENISGRGETSALLRKASSSSFFLFPSKKQQQTGTKSRHSVCIIWISCCCHRGNSFSLASSSTKNGSNNCPVAVMREGREGSQSVN